MANFTVVWYMDIDEVDTAQEAAKEVCRIMRDPDRQGDVFDVFPEGTELNPGCEKVIVEVGEMNA